MGVFYFPRDFVYWTKVKHHEEIKKDWMIKVKNSKGGEHESLVKGRTSYNQIDKNFILENANYLNNIVWEPINEVLENISPKIKFKSGYISKAWFSEYEVGGIVKYHNHDASSVRYKGETFYPTFSLIYILHDESDHNQTVFTSIANSTSKDRVISFETKGVSDISEGSVIIFPSSLMHKVDSIQKPGRVIVSINIDSSFSE